MASNFDKLMELSKAGQKEYVLSEDAFDNFNRLGKEMNLDRKKILWVYLRKHLDGITSYLNGHKSQRESVHGRIHDAIVYLQLLDAMITEEEERMKELEKKGDFVVRNDQPLGNEGRPFAGSGTISLIDPRD